MSCLPPTETDIVQRNIYIGCPQKNTPGDGMMICSAYDGAQFHGTGRLATLVVMTVVSNSRAYIPRLQKFNFELHRHSTWPSTQPHVEWLRELEFGFSSFRASDSRQMLKSFHSDYSDMSFLPSLEMLKHQKFSLDRSSLHGTPYSICETYNSSDGLLLLISWCYGQKPLFAGCEASSWLRHEQWIPRTYIVYGIRRAAKLEHMASANGIAVSTPPLRHIGSASVTAP